ncbi:MAG: hypothetical protein H7248_02210 [Microbacteriaceae bacterium]|nr:hypothetical protein [Microbacteriaceae bacterium]
MHTISDATIPGIDEAEELYSSVRWTSYTNSRGTLSRALIGSGYMVTPRSAEKILVGLARAISDDASI